MGGMENGKKQELKRNGYKKKNKEDTEKILKNVHKAHFFPKKQIF